MKLLLAECFQLVLRVPARFEQNTRFSEVLMSNLIGMILAHGHMMTWTRRTSQGAPDWPSFLALAPLAMPSAPRDLQDFPRLFQPFGPSVEAASPTVKAAHAAQATAIRRGDSTLLSPPATHASAQMAPQWLQPSQDRLSPT